MAFQPRGAIGMSDNLSEEDFQISHVEGRKGGFIDGAANFISLAASPIFAIMALLTVFAGERGSIIICSIGQGGSPLLGMGAMYTLMTIVHSPPWFRLLDQGKSSAGSGDRKGAVE